MSTISIYGASDDLVEVEGLVSDEFGCYGAASVNVFVKVDDALYAVVSIAFDPDGSGEWRVQTTTAHGSHHIAVWEARGEDDGDDQDGCPGYSDKAVVDMGEIEARRVNVGVEVLR